MTLMLFAFVLLGGVELLVMSPWLAHVHRPLAIALIVALALLTGSITGTEFTPYTVVFAIMSLYRIVGLLRIIQNRAPVPYLQQSVPLTTITIGSLQLVTLAAMAIAKNTALTYHSGWLLVAAVQVVTALVLFTSTRRHLRTTLPLSVSEHFSDAHLPSLSVCIPARNETTELELCLRSLTASSYPKLEIIVLDDCSQGTRTSDIIRGFAHDGVRFIQGDVPPEGWLAKNWAYQRLYEASSGKFVLFCGADVRFEPAALRTLVTTLLAKEKRMASVVPRNILSATFRDQLKLLVQPARYFWELSLPRRMFRRPPVLSSCWIAERSLLDRAGTFKAVRNTITPEAYFARKALLRDGYSFIQAAGDLGVTSYKSLADQWETAVRTRYPQLRRRPEMVFVVSSISLVALVAPPLVIVMTLLQGLWLPAFGSGLATLLVLTTYGQIVSLTYRRFVWLGFLLGPLAILVDIYVRHESMWRYEFSEITWKSRNICLPVMRVIPRFPKV